LILRDYADDVCTYALYSTHTVVLKDALCDLPNLAFLIYVNYFFRR
jgi:hypothetical protein